MRDTSVVLVIGLFIIIIDMHSMAFNGIQCVRCLSPTDIQSLSEQKPKEIKHLNQILIKRVTDWSALRTIVQ